MEYILIKKSKNKHVLQFFDMFNEKHFIFYRTEEPPSWNPVCESSPASADYGEHGPKTGDSRLAGHKTANYG